MKKFYLLLMALAITCTAQARKISFYLGDQLIEKGSTVQFNTITEEEYSGALLIAPPLYIGSDTETQQAQFTMRCTSGQSLSVCTGGTCVMGSNVTKTGLSISKDGKLAMDIHYESFDADSSEDLPKDIILDISGQDGTYSTSASNFTIVLNSSGSGIATVFGDKPELRVAGRRLAYKVNGHATISLYNILGVRALHVPVTDAGTVSLESLPKGIYVYTVEGDSNFSGKISIP